MTLNERFSDELLVFGSEFGDLTNGICDFVIANAVKQSVRLMQSCLKTIIDAVVGVFFTNDTCESKRQFDAVVGVFFTNNTCESKNSYLLGVCFRKCYW